MKTMRALRAAVLGGLTLASACATTVPDDSSPLPSGTAASPIESGKFINDGVNPESSMFPLATVNLQYSVKTIGVTTTASCTGVIVSPTQILTASHCQVTPSWTVNFYPTATNPANKNDPAVSSPLGPLGTSILSVTPAPGTQGCTDPPTTQNCGNNGTYADLKIVTLNGPVPSPYVAVPIGPSGSYSGTHGTLDGGNGDPNMPHARANWAVGTGNMNPGTGRPTTATTTGDPSNPYWQMEWAAGEVNLYHGNAFDSGGLFSAKFKYTDPGDSGGPFFEANYGGLILVGILSGSNTATPPQSTYTSVENPVNNAWIRGQLVAAPPVPTPPPVSPDPHGPTAPPNVASFGAALVE